MRVEAEMKKEEREKKREADGNGQFALKVDSTHIAIQ